MLKCYSFCHRHNNCCVFTFNWCVHQTLLSRPTARYCGLSHDSCSAMQCRTAVTAYVSSKQLPLFDFALLIPLIIRVGQWVKDWKISGSAQILDSSWPTCQLVSNDIFSSINRSPNHAWLIKGQFWANALDMHVSSSFNKEVITILIFLECVLKKIWEFQN